MAIYHLSGSVISRSQGRSAVACSAYRSGEKLLDARCEKTHDYTQKKDVAYTEIFLPEGAPERLKDRETLWNEVERCEKRKDAQLAREVQISLPKELTLEQNIFLAREFVQQEFVSRGMIADMAIHVDKSPDGEPQPHAHIMLTFREVNEEGFGKKVREWNAKENLLLWRESWAEVANRHLSLNGHDIRIDHRSNVELGIELEPQYKIGAVAARSHMVRMADHERIAKANGEKIFLAPQIALDALTRQQSTFSHYDLARFVNRHTVDAEQFKAVYEKVKSCEQLVRLGVDEKGVERFTSVEMLSLEKRMIEHGDILSERKNHSVSESSKSIEGFNLSDEQKIAYSHLADAGDLKCVVGHAGTGKSYLLGATREAWEAEGYRVHGVTLSGIAAENLEASSGIESRTLASRLYYWDKGDEHLTRQDILVVDEAGMIGSRQMERLLNEAQKHNTKVVLIGDTQQLQAIEAGAAFRAIVERHGYVELTEIRRQKEGWQREATSEFAKGKIEEGLSRYQKHENIHEFETQAMAKKALMETWNDARLSDPQKTQIMLAYTRVDVSELNDMARLLRHQNGELGAERVFMTSRGERTFAENDRIYFLKNDRGLDVKNGTLGTIEHIEKNTVTVKLDKEMGDHSLKSERVLINLDQYDHIDHGYAATIHKSQGVTVDRSYLLASKYMDSHSTYVGMTRHREGADLFYSREEFAQEKDLVNALSRDRSKDVTLDYDGLREEFAEQRGIKVSDKVIENVQKNIQPEIKQPQEQEPEKEIKPDLMKEFGFSESDIRKFQEKPKDELAEFTKAFERENPELAKSLNRELETAHEKRILRVENTFAKLNERLEKEPNNPAISREMKEFAATVAKDEKIMQHIKEHDPTLNRQIDMLSKHQERERDRGRER